MPKVELIFFAGCPNVTQAREQLRQALAQAGLTAQWQEWDRDDPSYPVEIRNFGSPTILVDRRDVAGSGASDAGCCRVYPDSTGRLQGVPTLETIVSALKRVEGKGATETNNTRGKKSWLGNLGILPGIGVAFLPGLTCPACWPMYASFLGSMGVGFFNYTPYMAPLTGFFLLLAVGSLGFRARRRRGYGPFFLGLFATITFMLSKFVFISDVTTYAGIALLVGASVWNGWPQRSKASAPCPACNTSDRVIEIHK